MRKSEAVPLLVPLPNSYAEVDDGDWFSARWTFSRTSLLCVLVATIGCQEAVAPAQVGSMTAVSATTQDAVVGNLVSQQPAVLVRDGHGQPAQGVRAVFVETALVSPFTATTGPDGIATSPWFVGTRARMEFLTAKVEGLQSVVFIANVRPDAPHLIAPVTAAEQVADPAQILVSQPQVRVWDQYGNITPGVTVTFTATTPSNVGTTNTTAITDADGLATYGDWVIGTAGGEYTITATFAGRANLPAVFRVRINTPFPASLIAAGGTATCAVAVSGGLYCWGTGLFTNAATTPTLVTSSVSFVSLSVGDHHACGLTSAGAAYCWGNNGIGQLGIGSLTSNEAQPRAVAGGLAFASLAAGDSFTCGLTTDRRVFCWGDNAVGELGNGSTTASLTPTAIQTTEQFTALAAGLGHVCAIAATGAAYCWGANNTGQLGGSSTDTCLVPGVDYYSEQITTAVTCSKTPIVMAKAPGTFTALVASSGTCGLVAGAQTAFCWGYPDNDILLPPATFLSLAAGSESVCGTTPRQTILCWSYVTPDPYGDGGIAPPPMVLGIDTPTSLVAGFGHWCAISATTGSAYCWGNNMAGELGDGLHTSSTSAVRVAGP